MTVQVLLSEVPEKQKIIFVLPIRLLDRTSLTGEGSEEEELPVLVKPKHRVKRQRSGSLKETASYEEQDSLESDDDWLTRSIDRTTREESQNHAHTIEEIGDTIKVEEPATESRKILTKEEQVEKRHVQ